jgi:hypothetical protein
VGVSYDWVDEVKLFLFIKTQIAERVPHKGGRLAAERKRTAKEGAKIGRAGHETRLG